MDKIQKINQSHYDNQAEKWADIKTHSFWHEANFRRLIKYLKKGDNVIELGAAHGICVPLFLGIGRDSRYIGIDISKNLLSIAKRRYPQLDFKESNLLDYKTLPRGKFDGFWAPAVMMHIPEKDWPMMLTNIEKLVKKDGVGYLTLPEERPNPASKDDQRYFSFWTYEKLKKIVEPRGWKILQHGKMPETAAQWNWFIIRMPK